MLATRMDRLGTETAFVILARAKALEAKGYPGSKRLKEDIEAFLVEKNMGLVGLVAGGFRLQGEAAYENARSDGVAGLITAIRRFEWRRGHKFSTYAMWWLKNTMVRGRRLAEHVIHIPEHILSELSRLSVAREALLQRLGR